MGRITSTEIDDIIQFVVKNHSYKIEDYKYMYQVIAQHAAYDTMVVVRDKKDEVIAVCRWNVLPTGQDAVILDLIIHPDWRRKRMITYITSKGLSMYPSLKYIIFERHDKGKLFKKIPIKWLLNRRF